QRPSGALPAPSTASAPGLVPSAAPALKAAPVQAQCEHDSDCLGPHSAACVRAHCVDHHCVYDERSCACRDNAQCDDGDPCTRDLCFSRTNACIHVEEGCTSADGER
ncbi:MAG TPA: hypothetical protein VN764_07170, partial [Polyangiaceae bacterium]|nr:hypothetical protein [Polyangiaceae bacterium]